MIPSSLEAAIADGRERALIVAARLNDQGGGANGATSLLAISVQPPKSVRDQVTAGAALCPADFSS